MSVITLMILYLGPYNIGRLRTRKKKRLNGINFNKRFTGWRHTLNANNIYLSRPSSKHTLHQISTPIYDGHGESSRKPILLVTAMPNLTVQPLPHWQELAHLTKDSPDGTWQVRYATVSPASSNLTGITLLACNTDTARQHLTGRCGTCHMVYILTFYIFLPSFNNNTIFIFSSCFIKHTLASFF